MDSKTRQEIDDMIYQLGNISRELDSISQGIANDFKGIGVAKCANSVSHLAGRYRKVRNELLKIK